MTDCINKEDIISLYKKTGDINLRNKAVLAYMNVVDYAVFSTRNIYIKYADPQDIVGEATIALMSAIEGFDFEKNVKFETYASIKVRGAIIDFIRRQDIIPRKIRKFAKDYDIAYSKLYIKNGIEPTDEEIATDLSLSKERFYNYSASLASAQTLSLEEMFFSSDGESFGDIPSNDGFTPEEEIYRKEIMVYLAKAIDSLKEKERLVITLYYYERLKFSEIGLVLDLSESRICQIHSASVSKIKLFMKDYI